MRKFQRRIAHAKMEKAGIKRMNKRDYTGASFFSRHWREWV